MKAFYSMVFLLLLVIGVIGQSLPDLSASTPVLVLKKDWDMIRKQNNKDNSLLDTDPFAPIKETTQALKDYEYSVQQEKIKARQGIPRDPQAVQVFPTKTANTQMPESPAVYFYKVKVRNNDNRTIQTLIWDYVFFKPGTNEEIGRRQFVSKTKISSGETRTLNMQSVSPPTGTIDVKQAGKKLRDSYSEEVFIRSIEFTDGSVWQAP
jgi:hypothetical protein